MTAAAKEAGCGKVTLYRWMKQPAFMAAVREAEAKALDELSRMLVRLGRTAVGTLAKAMSDPTAPWPTRVRAADASLARSVAAAGTGHPRGPGDRTGAQCQPRGADEMRGLASVPYRVARLTAALPPPAPRTQDFSRLTPDQRMRLAELIARYEDASEDGLTPIELEEVAALSRDSGTGTGVMRQAALTRRINQVRERIPIGCPVCRNFPPLVILLDEIRTRRRAAAAAAG